MAFGEALLPGFPVDIGVSAVQEEVWQWFATFSHTLFAESERYQWGSARTPSGGAKTRLPSLPILLIHLWERLIECLHHPLQRCCLDIQHCLAAVQNDPLFG